MTVDTHNVGLTSEMLLDDLVRRRAPWPRLAFVRFVPGVGIPQGGRRPAYVAHRRLLHVRVREQKRRRALRHGHGGDPTAPRGTTP